MAVILSAWYGGFGPGMLSTFIAVFGATYFFSPTHDPLPNSSATWIQAGSFLLQGVLLSTLSQISRQRGSAISRNGLIYESMVQSQSDLGEGVIFMDDGEIIYTNEAVRRISGYGADEGDKLADLVAATSLEASQKGNDPESRFELTAGRKDRSSVDLEVAAKTVRIGKHAHTIVLLRDITERKSVQENLRRSEEHYRLLVENVRDYAIFTLKKNGTIASWNEGAERIFGYNEDDVIGKPFSLVFPTDEQRQEPSKQLETAEKEGSASQEGWRLHKSGARFYGSGVITPLWTEKGSLRGYVCVVQDNTEQRHNEEKVKHQALHDALTDLPNRTLFCDRVDQAIAVAARNKQRLAVIFLDLDKFKNINDSLGHSIGDLLLQEVAARLSQAVRREDTVSRFGGDEFTVLLPELKEGEDGSTIIKKIFKALRPAFAVGGHELHINTSMGVALYPQDGADVQTLIRNADTALYTAKNQGRNAFQFYVPSMNVQATKMLELENELRSALDRHEFFLLYQPVVEAESGLIQGVEALVRWQHPDLGIVGPSDFIPLAEESGQIMALNEWIIKTACRQNETWIKQGLPNLRMSVNISARLFGQKDLVARIGRFVEESGIEPSSLELEVTESFAMADIAVAISRLEQLKSKGIRISIDDFGTGHSSLNYLKRLPVDTIKVDRSFVQGCATEKQDAEIIKAVVNIAHSRNLRVIAEGIETSEQRALLTEMGADGLQGFLFSEAVTPERIQELVAAPPL